MELEIIKSQRGSPLLLHDNFIYNKDGERGEKIRWRCKNRTCQGNVYTLGNEVTDSSRHNHANEIDAVVRLRALNAIRERAITTRERTNHIITSHTSVMSPEDITSLPFYSSIRDNLVRKRNKLFGFTSFDTDQIPDIIKLDLQGNLFLRFDSGYSDKDRVSRTRQCPTIYHKSPIIKTMIKQSL